MKSGRQAGHVVSACGWDGDLQLATGSLHVNEKLGSLHLELTRFQELGGFFSLGMSHDSKA
jgi:hypothetical protein